MSVYVYIYTVCVCVSVCIYIYIYIMDINTYNYIYVDISTINPRYWSYTRPCGQPHRGLHVAEGDPAGRNRAADAARAAGAAEPDGLQCFSQVSRVARWHFEDMAQ